MSSLLEEAIVDAKALKAAALKNAETAVLEKYSSEVKNALSTLLEQEMDAPMDDLGMDLGDEGAEPEEDVSDEFIDEVPYAFQNEELDAPAPDEIVEIDFDQLKARIDEEDEAVEGDDMIDATALADEVALDEGNALEDDEEEQEKQEGEEGAAQLGKSAVVDIDEEIDLTEEMLADLIEELTVDMTPRPQGWSAEGSAYNSIIQANDEAMAAAQDAHLEEEEEIEKVSTAPDVVSDAELYESKIREFRKSTKELKALLVEAKNQLSQLNLANAKLVYQNKALNSASLNERQKNKIVEAVQSAKSVEQANMIFETIQNAVGTKAEYSRRPQTLREAVTRPTSLLISNERSNKATKDPNMDRMLRLAGLNK
jgi:hypothetical protein